MGNLPEIKSILSYISREHNTKVIFIVINCKKLVFCHVAFGFYNIMQYIWHGFYELPKMFCINRDPQLYQDFHYVWMLVKCAS